MRLTIKDIEHNTLTDAELIEGWQHGNDRYFELLYKRHIVNLVTIAMQKTDDRASAEEIVQDAFIQFFTQRESLTLINSVPAYLYVIVKRKLLGHYKHEQVIKKYQDHLAQQAVQPHRNSVLEYLETKELESQLEKEIQKIPPQSRTVFKMRRVLELSNKQIAAELNISENTVEQHMRKAIRILRAAFYFAVLIPISLY